MLRQLIINDLAIIDKLDLEFSTGMTVFTGETGAGKSILLDAIGLILGDRGDTSVLRGSADATDITAVFLLTGLPEVQLQLTNMGVEIEDDELFVRRIVNKNGRSRAYLNNNPVPVQALRDVGASLVDVYGQHAHQSLSRPQIQRQLLDHYGEYEGLLKSVSATFNEWEKVTRQMQSFKASDEGYEDRIRLLRYHIEELVELDMGDNEFTELSDLHKRLTNSQQLLDACQTALSELSEADISIEERLAIHQRRFDELLAVDTTLKNVAELLDNAGIHITEAASELRDYIEHIDDDILRLAQVEKRLERYHDLARKHLLRPEELAAHLAALQEELERLEHGQKHHTELQTCLQKLRDRFFDQAAMLSKKRKQTAKQLSAAVTEKMHELGVGGRFKIEIETINEATPRQHGIDMISFLVAINPGQPLRPLGKVASGGELSRLGLAIQITGSRDSGVPTLIFDEVDTGISGGIAEIVGRLLHSLAIHRQIFCVTHLAQVASCGHQHLLVSKATANNETFVRVETLNGQQRIDEIARMLAGLTITCESRANAEKMLAAV